MLRITIALILISASAPAQGLLEKSALSDTLPPAPITSAQLDSVYSLVAAAEGIIDFADCNICKSRAHVTARVIEKRFPWITIGKAWLFADSKRKSKRDAYRYKPIVYLENNGRCSKWSYHVAPVIITQTDTFVIDPATQSKPAKLTDWALKLIPADGKGFLVIKDKRYFIYPDDDGNLFEDEKLIWADDNEDLFDDEYTRSIDEVVRATLGLVEPWRYRYFMKRLTEMVE